MVYRIYVEKKKEPAKAGSFLSVDFGFFGAAEDIVYADIVKISKAQKGFYGRDAFTVFKLRKQCLLNSGLHL